MTDEIRAIENTLRAFEPGLSEQFSGVRLMQESLERRLAQVTAALRGELDLSLTRDDPLSGAELPLVSGFLSALQESLAAIAQVLAGRPTARGLVPATIKESVQLRIV